MTTKISLDTIIDSAIQDHVLLTSGENVAQKVASWSNMVLGEQNWHLGSLLHANLVAQKLLIAQHNAIITLLGGMVDNGNTLGHVAGEILQLVVPRLQGIESTLQEIAAAPPVEVLPPEPTGPTKPTLVEAAPPPRSASTRKPKADKLEADEPTKKPKTDQPATG